MLLNCAGEDSWNSLGEQGDQTRQSWSNQPEYSSENCAEDDSSILWLRDEKSLLIGNSPEAGKDWKQKEKRAVEDEMVRYHHQLNGHEFEQTLQDRGQRSLACCSSWGYKELDMT